VRDVKVTLRGITPLLMHADNIEWSDAMDAWKNIPANKALSKAGDDRTPAWRWIGCLNYDDPQKGVVTIPSEYIMRCIMGGAAEVPTGKGRKTFKTQSQSGIMSPAFHWPMFINGKPIQMTAIQKLRKVEVFPEHQKAVEAMGFSLLVKRAKIMSSKHIRVRPRFDNWSATGVLSVTDKQITDEVLQSILDISGRIKGLGDWRPGCPTPGPWGMFEAVVEG
jgi:hypothetical protein